jgi:hypothetical protein
VRVCALRRLRAAWILPFRCATIMPLRPASVSSPPPARRLHGINQQSDAISNEPSRTVIVLNKRVLHVALRIVVLARRTCEQLVEDGATPGERVDAPIGAVGIEHVVVFVVAVENHGGRGRHGRAQIVHRHQMPAGADRELLPPTPTKTAIESNAVQQLEHFRRFAIRFDRRATYFPSFHPARMRYDLDASKFDLASCDWRAAGKRMSSRIISIKDFAHIRGPCFAAQLPACVTLGDTADEPCASRVDVLGEGRGLGPRHALHDRIIREGRGLFSHWHDQIYFATSDNSDPSANGRTYTIMSRASHRARCLDYAVAFLSSLLADYLRLPTRNGHDWPTATP